MFRVRSIELCLVLSLLAPPLAADEPDKQSAVAALEEGLTLYDQGHYEAALAWFLRSRSIYPARGNTLNAALCLSKLGRFDESLDMFESLLREVEELDEGERALIAREVAALRKRVGAVDVRVLEPGASVVIGGRVRATTPVSAPIRVAAGGHLVRVLKEGFVPLEVLVDVAGEQVVPVDGRLDRLGATGRLKIAARAGSAEVILDNAPVGHTPWEGAVSPGRHTVQLRGDGDRGTQPVTVEVDAGRVSTLSLAIERLACALHVAPTPAGAAVAIDGVTVGHGVWSGRLRCGAHRIEVADDGFLAVAREVELDEGVTLRLDVALERDPDSALWAVAHPPRIVVEAWGGPLLSPTLGGDVAGACGEGCDAGIPLGGWINVVAGYQLGIGFGFGAHLGYVHLEQAQRGRSFALDRVPSGGRVVAAGDDQRLLRAALLGAAVWFRRGHPWIFSAQLSGGVTLGDMHTTRDAALGQSRLLLSEHATAARFVHVASNLRAGYAIHDNVELALVVSGAALFAFEQPRWTQRDAPYTLDEGFVDFAEETSTGSAVLLLSPGVAGTFAF